MNLRLVLIIRALVSGTHFFQANRQTPSCNSAKMSTPSDKVLRKFENKINLGEFLRYISSLGYEKILQKPQSVIKFY